jgi:hypothetical protein
MAARMRTLLVASALSAAALATASDYTDYDHHVNFSKYHTYSWIAVKVDNSIWQDRIVGAVDGQLAARGWKRVPSGGDAAVSAAGRVTERDILQTYSDTFGGWGWGGCCGWGGGGWGGGGWGGWSSGFATTYVIPQQVGDLSVDVYDGATKKLIWQGIAEKTLSHKASKNNKKLEHAVRDMFERFPNGKG